jgi:hypothetical protein
MEWVEIALDYVFWMMAGIAGARVWNITTEVLNILKMVRNKMEDNGGTTRRRRATPVQRPGR